MTVASQLRPQVIDESLGGEVAVWIRETRATAYDCPLCGESFTVDANTPILGFRRTDGLEAGDGTGWSLYVECPVCSYGLSYDQFDAYRRR